MEIKDPFPVDGATQSAFARLCEWEGLARSDRLRGILQYLFDEAGAGRGADVKAKTIGMDVYGYNAEQLAERESVVRVDVGRLRRKLEEFYLEAGQNEPMRFVLPKGTYSLSFDRAEVATASDAPPTRSLTRPRIASMVAVAAAVLSGIAFVAFNVTQQETSAGANSDLLSLERSAIFEGSPARLRAINLAEVGRDLIFPALNPGQLEAAEVTFEAAITADDSFFGGYAGIAQVLATLAILTPKPEVEKQLLAQADRFSARASERAPEAAWAQSASAWVSFAKKDYQVASQQSARAVRLDPNDPHIVEFDALIALYTGDFDRVISESRRVEPLVSDAPGFVFRNAVGSALFHVGDYDGSIDAFEKAIATGGPVGPPVLAYLMAANQKLGRTERARELAAQFSRTWPDAAIDAALRRLFADQSHADDVIAAMRTAGWPDK